MSSGSEQSSGQGIFANRVLLNLIGNVFPPLAGFAIVPVLTRVLGVDGRGEMAAAVAPLLLLTALATLGVPDAVTYFIASRMTQVRATRLRAVMLLASSGLVTSLIVWWCAPFLSGDSPQLARLITFAGLALAPTLVVAVIRASAIGLHRWRLVMIERASGAGLRAAAIAVLALSGHLTVLSATVATALSPIIAGFVYVAIKAPSAEADLPRARYGELLGFGTRVWAGSIAGILLSRIDQALMTPLSSTYALGLYTVAATVSELPLIINNAVREVVFATDANGHDDKRLTAAARISGMACAIVGLALAVSLPAWLPWLFGIDFAGAIPVAFVLIAAVVIGPPGSVAGSGLSARGRPGLRSISLIIAAVVNVIALVLLAPVYGALGAAIATLIGNLIASNMNIWFAWRVLKIHPSDFYIPRKSDFVLVKRTILNLIRRTGGSK